MRNEFISKIYDKINPIVNSWAVNNEKDGKVKYYSNIRNIEDKDYWAIKIECSNDYHISLQFHDVDVNVYKSVTVLNVKVDGPAIITNSFYSVALGYNVPTTIDTYTNRKVISFCEGQFDIDSNDWVNDIMDFMNKWVNEDKADVEGLK